MNDLNLKIKLTNARVAWSGIGTNVFKCILYSFNDLSSIFDRKQDNFWMPLTHRIYNIRKACEFNEKMKTQYSIVPTWSIQVRIRLTPKTFKKM